MIKSLACLVILLSTLKSACAWGAFGHMVVAQIAYNHLNPNAKAQCDALIAVPLEFGSSANNTFVTASCWADDYKSSLDTAIWHYIDLPFSLDGTPTTNFIPENFDVVQALNQCIPILQDTNAAATNRATCLRYILHFVGDIHQPLHCSTAIWSSKPGGDAGGNGFSINGQWSNLHSLWDAGGGAVSNSLSRPLNASRQATLDAKVSAIEASNPFTPDPGTIPDPMNWAQEGLLLSETIAYVGITQSSTPTTAYLSNVQFTASERLAIGGHRLADLLNTIFPPPPIALTSVLTANGMFRLSWSAVSNTSYRIQWKQELTDPAWHDLTNLTASSNSASFSEPPTQNRRFYRVVQ